MTQSLRALLAGQGATVHAVVLGPIDTDMNRGFNIPKASPESAARGIFEGLERDAEGEVPCALLCRPKPGHGSSFSWTAAS
jgi:NAD(P)-dependent dehydrogenase (short-subunit alcohol dehydrogenase family)